MNWLVGAESLQGAFPDGCAVTLGVFDGVHLGHHALIEATVSWARRHGVPAVALTFEPHPAAILSPEHCPPMLCPLAHRVQRLQRAGIDCVVVQPFTHALAQLSAEAFIEQVLKSGLNARAVVVGDDFRFGHRRSGDVQTLRASGAFEVITISGVLSADGERISSTRIRILIQQGLLEQANALLGEPFTWAGVVAHGDRRGRTLGYPTANLVPIEPLITPQEGVYACLAWSSDTELHEQEARATQAHTQGGRRCAAAVSVGKPPMFENARGRVEAHLIDFPDLDLYGRVVWLQFLKRLRPQQRFDSVDALKQQMAHDVAQARQIAQEVLSLR